MKFNAKLPWLLPTAQTIQTWSRSRAWGTASHDADMGYMRPKNPGNIERDLRVAVKRMTKGKIANLPKGSIMLPVQVTKGPNQG